VILVKKNHCGKINMILYNNYKFIYYVILYINMTSQGAFTEVVDAAEPDRTSVGVRDGQTGRRGRVFLHCNRHGRTWLFH